jgi:hypothetical protein
MTQDDLKSILKYDPMTGIFTWIKGGKGRPASLIAGSISNQGYIKIHYLGRFYRAHRLAWLYVYGEMPSSALDHINGNPSDNSVANLRLATAFQNQCNRSVAFSNTSGLKGVSYQTQTKKWRAQIKVNGKGKYLGSFSDPQDAHKAYCQASRELHGEFSRVL